MFLNILLHLNKSHILKYRYFHSKYTHFSVQFLDIINFLASSFVALCSRLWLSAASAALQCAPRHSAALPWLSAHSSPRPAHVHPQRSVALCASPQLSTAVHGSPRTALQPSTALRAPPRPGPSPGPARRWPGSATGPAILLSHRKPCRKCLWRLVRVLI